LLLNIYQGMAPMIMSRRYVPLPGRSGEQADRPANPRPDRAAREAMKQERTRSATQAMKDYEAERRAVVANTERLRALRLAKEAGEAGAKPVKPAKKGS
jgi:hypothetical protein